MEVEETFKWSEIARLEQRRGSLSRALAASKRAEAAARRSGDEENVSATLTMSGQILMCQGRLPEARRRYRDALECFGAFLTIIQALIKIDPDNAASSRDLAISWERSAWRWPRGAAKPRRSSTIRERKRCLCAWCKSTRTILDYATICPSLSKKSAMYGWPRGAWKKRARRVHRRQWHRQGIGGGRSGERPLDALLGPVEYEGGRSGGTVRFRRRYPKPPCRRPSACPDARRPRTPGALAWRDVGRSPVENSRTRRWRRLVARNDRSPAPVGPREGPITRATTRFLRARRSGDEKPTIDGRFGV